MELIGLDWIELTPHGSVGRLVSGGLGRGGVRIMDDIGFSSLVSVVKVTRWYGCAAVRYG